MTIYGNDSFLKLLKDSLCFIVGNYFSLTYTASKKIVIFKQGFFEFEWKASKLRNLWIFVVVFSPFLGFLLQKRAQADVYSSIR